MEISPKQSFRHNFWANLSENCLTFSRPRCVFLCSFSNGIIPCAHNYTAQSTASHHCLHVLAGLADDGLSAGDCHHCGRILCKHAEAYRHGAEKSRGQKIVLLRPVLEHRERVASRRRRLAVLDPLRHFLDLDLLHAFPRISDPLAVVLEQPVIADEPVRPEVCHLDFKVEYSPFPVPRSHP